MQHHTHTYHTHTHTPTERVQTHSSGGEKGEMRHLSVQAPENMESNQWTVTSNISGNLALYEVVRAGRT